jgi:hypothetical protein
MRFPKIAMRLGRAQRTMSGNPTYQDLAARTSPRSLGAGVLLLFSKTYHIGQIYVSHRSMILGEMALRGV